MIEHLENLDSVSNFSIYRNTAFNIAVPVAPAVLGTAGRKDPEVVGRKACGSRGHRDPQGHQGPQPSLGPRVLGASGRAQAAGGRRGPDRLGLQGVWGLLHLQVGLLVGPASLAPDVGQELVTCISFN